jgi:hypothetical protein
LHLDCGWAIAQQCWSPTMILASHAHPDRNMGQSSEKSQRSRSSSGILTEVRRDGTYWDSR